MKCRRKATFFLAGIALSMAGCVSMPLSPAEEATASLAPLSRPGLSLQPVPRKPSVGLNLAVFGPYGEGEVFEGGELDEIISGFSGPRPKLQMANPARHDDLSDERVLIQVAPDQIGPVHYHLSSSELMNLGKASLDGALMVMPYSGLFDRGPDQSKSADPKEAAKPGRVFDLYRKPDPAPAKGSAPAAVVPG